jgi:D-arginine dehydrogenase
MAEAFDFAVIGAGIAGASVAWRLAAHGRVVVIEQESQPGYHSTSRSAAVLSCAYGPESWQILTTASAAFYDAPPDGFSDVPLTKPRGALYLATAAEEAGLRARQAWLASRGVPCTPIDPEAAHRLVPVVHRGEFTIGLYEPGCVEIDANALLRAYLRAGPRSELRLLAAAEVRRIERRDSVWRLDAAGRTIEAPVLVNAAGAWADEIAARAGLRRRGLRPFRRTAILFDPPEPDAAGWPMTFDAAETWYFKPEAGRIMMSPVDAVATPPCDAQPDELDVAIAIDRIETVTSMKVGRLAGRWAGLRTFAPDHEAVIGPDPDDPSFIWYAGQGGNGVMASAAAGALAAAAALGEPMPRPLIDLGLTTAMVAPGRLAPATTP